MSNLLILTSLISLFLGILGLFIPNKTLFWRKTDLPKKEGRKLSSKIYFITFIISFILAGSSLDNEKYSNSLTEPKEVVPSYKVIKVKTTGTTDKYVDLFIEVANDVDSSGMVYIAGEERMKYLNSQKVSISFYQPGDYSDTINNNHAAVWYPEAEYVRDEIKDKDHKGNKFMFLKINKSNIK